MNTGRKFVLALIGLAGLCVFAAMAAPLAMGDGTGHKNMMNDSARGQFALENCDRECNQTLLQENRPAGAPMMNGEGCQQMIQKMHENGIETTGLETAIENGDREGVRAFMQENGSLGACIGFRHGIHR